MEIVALWPVISGVIGATIAIWVLHKIAKWVPTTCNGRPIAEIAHKHRWKVRSANVLGFATLLGGVALYKLEFLPNNDWRGLGLAFGAACWLPALLLIVTAAFDGREAIREALVSYAVGQDTPPPVLNSIMVAGTILFFVTIASMLSSLTSESSSRAVRARLAKAKRFCSRLIRGVMRERSRC